MGMWKTLFEGAENMNDKSPKIIYLHGNNAKVDQQKEIIPKVKSNALINMGDFFGKKIPPCPLILYVV